MLDDFHKTDRYKAAIMAAQYPTRIEIRTAKCFAVKQVDICSWTSDSLTPDEISAHIKCIAKASKLTLKEYFTGLINEWRRTWFKIKRIRGFRIEFSLFADKKFTVCKL